MAKKAKSPDESAPESPSSNGANEESVSGYFRKIFEENPKLLNSRSNEELLRRWLADHPEHTEVPKKIKASLSNLKSVLRSKGRKKTAKAQAAAPTATAKPRSSVAKTHLEKLEEQIDDCLTAARTLDRDQLGDVIIYLRKARNAVVWQMGQ